MIFDDVMIKVFTAFYWCAREEIANKKAFSLIELIKSLGLKELEYFQYSSERTKQEIYLAIGDTIKSQILEQAKSARWYSLLADEVADVALVEQLVTFIQFVANGNPEVKFLSIQNILEDSQSADASAITGKILQELEKDELPLEQLSGIASDGARVFTGTKDGVGA